MFLDARDELLGVWVQTAVNLGEEKRRSDVSRCVFPRVVSLCLANKKSPHQTGFLCEIYSELEVRLNHPLK